MKAIINDEACGTVVLTTDHADSCFGVPVLLIGPDAAPQGCTEFEALGPGDTVPGGARAYEIVSRWADDERRSELERAFASSFLSVFAHTVYTQPLR